MSAEYHVLHFTSKPLKKKVYSPSDIRLLEPVKKSIDEEIEVVSEEQEVEIPSIQELELEVEESPEEEEIVDEKPGFLQMFFGIKPKSNKRKDKNSKHFDIWEDVPEEPIDEGQLEVAKIINKDGYYDTIKPEDEGMVEIRKFTMNKKIVGLILLGVGAIAFLIVEVVFFI